MEVKHHSIETVKFTLTLVLPVLLFLLFLLFPFYWIFIASIKPGAEVYVNPLLYWSQHWTRMTYEKLFNYFNFIKYMKNSLTVAVATMVVSLVFSALAVYTFSRFEFKGREFLMGLFLSNSIFPTVLLMIPLYSVVRSIDLLYTPTGLVLTCTTFTIPFSVWLVQGFIRDVPFSSEEAALIDGYNRTDALVRIFLPILTLCPLAAGVYISMQGWNEYTLSSMFTNPATRTIPVALSDLIDQLGIKWNMLCASDAVTVPPVCIVFLFAQKKLVLGLTAGAVKGQTLFGSGPYFLEKMGNL